jgi:prophage tail gpP-like protein
MTVPDELTLEVGGTRMFGWNSIRVTRGIERCPNDFELSMTEHYPGELDFIVQAGDACRVLLGDDLVITGFVDRFVPSIGAGQHSITVSGRGRCADLVDCAAEWPGGQISASSALGVAQKLCLPYEPTLTASCLGDAGPPIPQLPLNLGETAFEVIERVCRFAALLAYEGADGNLILNGVPAIDGGARAASGFEQGINVQSASAVYSIDQQFSEYLVVRLAMDVTYDLGDTGNIVIAVDNPNVKRHRRRIILAESGDPGSEIAKQRAYWECARRIGRSSAVRITTDGWRDSAGVLYTPNTLVNIHLPALKISKKLWLISEVTYRRDENGTACDLVIMPREAFLPQPVLLQPAAADVPAAAGAA